MLTHSLLRTAVVVTAASAMAIATAPLSSAASETTANYKLDEPAGASTMVDSGPAGLDGQVGSGVQTGKGWGGLTAYKWPFVQRIGTRYLPERIVTVPDADLLDADGTSFEVSLRFRTKQAEKNIMNKGQSGNRDGFWKIETGNGKVKCVFRGPNRGLSLVSRTVVADDKWHTLTCTLTENSLTLVVDDQAPKTRVGSTGPIDNRRPLSIGGKSNCDQVKIDCDYYSGWMDDIRITKAG